MTILLASLMLILCGMAGWLFYRALGLLQRFDEALSVRHQDQAPVVTPETQAAELQQITQLQQSVIGLHQQMEVLGREVQQLNMIAGYALQGFQNMVQSGFQEEQDADSDEWAADNLDEDVSDDLSNPSHPHGDESNEAFEAPPRRRLPVQAIVIEIRRHPGMAAGPRMPDDAEIEESDLSPEMKDKFRAFRAVYMAIHQQRRNMPSRRHPELN